MRAPHARASLRAVLLAVAAVATAVTVAAGAGAEGPADAAPVDSLCAPGQPGVIYGTQKDDKISGTNGDDVICGLGGNDDIDGKGGNDVVYAGPGDDTVSGGTDDDKLFGEEGNDTLDGASGNDAVLGGDGNDTLSGASGDDAMLGGAGADTISGASGNDKLAGGAGDDSLAAAEGDDILDGGAGTDVLDAASGDDICTNGETVSGCERGKQALSSLANGLTVTRPVAPAQTIKVDDRALGVSLTVDTNGGIYPWDVKVDGARALMGGVAARQMAGPPIDISVPKGAPAFKSATLTLPYSESRLGGYPESDLRVWTFDAKTQFWMPVPGAQTVDAAANTVTVSLAHFSVYAVLKMKTPDEWKQIFQNTPLRCTGSAAGIDVAFLIDVSGSMSWNDPSNVRVDAAEAFVDAMRQQDRAAVIGFDSLVEFERGLTALDSKAGVDAVKSTLEQTRVALDGTDISVAVRDAISILSQNGGDGRLRVALLLTDGVSPYDTTLTTTAAQNEIEIYTVGLGSDTNPTLLSDIASGTGATYQHLDDPTQLVSLYQQLAADIIGDSGQDSDGDGLSDCVETNGMFVPMSITLPFVGPVLNFASFITTDPKKKDTDGDGIPDGAEVAAHPLTKSSEPGATYPFLVDKGLNTYYTLKSDPTKKDTDGDGLDDGLELLNGTDPLVPDASELGIPGLAPDTLFQPDRYTRKPEVAERLRTIDLGGGKIQIKPVWYNDNPVRYDGDRNCVETCDAIRKYAESLPNDGFCIFGFIGSCVTDDSQVRDIVESARKKQGIFASNGNLDPNFLREQVALQCSTWYSDAQKCFDEASKLPFDDNLGGDDFAKALAAGTIAIPAPGAINPEAAQAIARALAATAAVAAAGIAADQLADAIRNCMEGPALSVVRQILPFVHPCEQLPMYSPGGDSPLASAHRLRAIGSNPTLVAERYATQAMRDARGVARNWYIGQPGCTAADRTAAIAKYGGQVACDEFPNWSMERGGPSPLTSLEYLPGTDNSREGTNLLRFFNFCPDVTAPERPTFLVVPVPVLPTAVFDCGD